MPPKLLNDQRDLILIRPMVYCQEQDLKNYAMALALPVCATGCQVERQSARHCMQQWLNQLTHTNPKIPSNMLHALEEVKLSQLMDRKQFNFMDLEQQLDKSL